MRLLGQVELRRQAPGPGAGTLAELAGWSL